MTTWDSTAMAAPHTKRELGIVDAKQADLITTAAKLMLDNYNAFLAGRPFDAAMNDRLVLAAIYGTAAYRAEPSRNTGTTALIKVFLQALISTSHPDLDYLRGGLSGGAKAREARNG